MSPANIIISVATPVTIVHGEDVLHPLPEKMKDPKILIRGTPDAVETNVS